MTDTSITIRPLTTREEYEACVSLQRDIWGHDFVDVVPATILMVSQRVGGDSSGAFTADGHLVGFVIGISGVRHGLPSHWSDMLAVRPEVRRQGLGRQLKLHQREQLLALGIERVFWSFDPLVSRNAQLNLTSLGATAREFVPNMYGDTGSVLHAGLATDRVIADWRLTDPAVERALAGTPVPLPTTALQAPIVVSEQDAGLDTVTLPDAQWVRIECPSDIDALKTSEPERAASWQRIIRRSLTTYLNERHAYVAGIHHDASSGRWFYAVHTESNES